MNKIVFPFLAIVLLIFSCNSKDDNETIVLKKDKISIFPVTEFLEGQLKNIENSPVTPLKLIITDGKTDSVWITREEIREFAEPFLTPLIDSSTLSSYFDGQSFLDQTINSVTFTYDANQALPNNISLRRIDVYADPESGNITKVYLLKEKGQENVLTKVQLTWKTDQWCSIRSIVQKEEETPVITEEKVTWNFD